MQIRRYRDSDHAGLITFWAEVFPGSSSYNDPEQVISAKLDVDDLIFIAEDSSHIIGTCMAGYDGHRGWLYLVAVDPRYRRTGIGSRLVERTLDSLRDLGCAKVNLQIRAENHAVEGFYRSLGFQTEARISMGMPLDTSEPT